MTKPRQYHYGGVPRTALQSTINDTDELGLMIVIGAAEATNWPTIGPYVVRIERGTPREEAFLVSGRSGSNLLVVQRGYDDTPQVAHTAGSAVFVEHTIDATWVNTVDGILALPTTAGDMLVTNGTQYVRLPVGANMTVPVADNTLPAGIRWGLDPVIDMVAAAGDLLYGTGADSLARLPIGTSGLPLVVLAGLPSWGQVGGAGIQNDSIDTQHLADESVTTPKIAPGAITSPLIGPGVIQPIHMSTSAAAAVVDIDNSMLYVGDTTVPTNIWSLDVPAGTAPGTIYDLEAFGALRNGTGAKAWTYFRVGHIGNYIEFLIGASSRVRAYSWHIRQRFVTVSPTVYRVWVEYRHAVRDPDDDTEGATAIEDGSMTSPIQFTPSWQLAATYGTTADLALPLVFTGQVQFATDTVEQYVQCYSAQLTKFTS